MYESPQATLRVALMARDCERGEFRALLEDEGIEVVIDRGPYGTFAGDWNDVDVLLVDLDDQATCGSVEEILQRSTVPVLLNAGGVGSSVNWHRRLVGKLQALANRPLADAAIRGLQRRPELQIVKSTFDATDGEPDAHWVIVLGASIGGPKALARFLQALPPDLPATFLVGQHISEPLQELLAEQLDRCSRWPVCLLGESQVLEPGHVWLVPSECRIELDEKGVARRVPAAWDSLQRPDIDTLLRSVAGVFGRQCGVILFSGLGKDGAIGCGAISRVGGFVWVQSAESCVIPNMPDAARRHCSVELSGSPERLAQALAERCQPPRASIN